MSDTEPWCDHCGTARDTGAHSGCLAARSLEPPRYCPRCRRRMRVQVLPAGWTATCARHGTSTAPSAASGTAPAPAPATPSSDGPVGRGG